MPIYTYYCETCRHLNEEQFAYKDRPEGINCRQCSSVARYMISAPNFEVNGANAANRYSGDSNYRWIGRNDDES